MKNLYLLVLIMLSSLSLYAQEKKPEIRGKLSTGELLTGVFSSNIFIFGSSYAWHTSTDAAGTNPVEVGKLRTYRLTQEDAGKYIRFEVTTFIQFGRKVTYYSDWYGTVKNSIPLIAGTVTISGVLKPDNTISANYIYNPDNYPESGSTYNWYQAESAAGSGPVSIPGSSPNLLLTSNHIGKYFRVEVIPRDDQGVKGAVYTSAWHGPVEKPAPPINQPPTATNVRIQGNPIVCGTITGAYDYSDAENDAESNSTYRWLRTPEAGGTPTPVPDAVSVSYTITADDQGKYLYFEVTPKATNGNTTGNPVMSNPTSLIQNVLPTVAFSGDASICEGTSVNISLAFTGTPPFKLDYTNGSKNFSLNTSNYTHQLSVNSGGTYKGVKLTDNLNCPVTTLPSSATVSVKPKPDVNFEIANTCYNNDSTIFMNTSSSKNLIRAWNWNFGDNSATETQNKSTLEAPKHKYSSTGKFTVQLIGENNEGCKDSTIKSIQLGEKPVADFSWDRECFAAGKVTNFKSLTTSKDKISRYNWTIRDAGKLLKESNSSDFSYNIPNQGSYSVSLKVTTEYNCQDSVGRSLTVQPVFHLKDSFYYDNFEKANPTWSIAQKTANNWYRGDPEGQTISSPNSSGNAYYTAFKGPRINQQLVVSSPCFDFTDIQNPFIELWINYASQKPNEGAVLQYIQDGETTWKNAGELNTGINWFNHDAIVSKPGSQGSGWTGNSNGWVKARQSLDGLSNKSNTRFRVVYASQEGAQGDGFAFDDVFIGQRSKKVLFEYFTNLSDPYSRLKNLTMDSVLNIAGQSAVGIQYHTSFPGPDSLNAQNQANPAARVLYYGISSVPASVLDGGVKQEFIYDFTVRKPNLADINVRSLYDPEFNLKISSAVGPNTIAGNVAITSLKEVSSKDMTLNIAIVEDIKVQSGTQSLTLRNVLKYLYPSAAGTLLPSNWSRGQVKEIPFSWQLQNVYDPSKLKVVAFLQHNITHEVYQVEVSDKSTITSGNELPGNEEAFSIKIYPNPAREFITVSFGKALDTDFHMQIIQIDGRIVNEIIVKKGTTILDLSLSNIHSGLHLIKLYNKNGEIKTGKFISE